MNELCEQMKALAAAHAFPVTAEVVERQRARIAELEGALQAAVASLERASRDFATLGEIATACASTNMLRSRQGASVALYAIDACQMAIKAGKKAQGGAS